MTAVTSRTDIQTLTAESGLGQIEFGHYKLLLGSRHGGLLASREHQDSWVNFSSIKQWLQRQHSRLPSQPASTASPAATITTLKIDEAAFKQEFRHLSAEAKRVMLVLAGLDGAWLNLDQLRHLTMLAEIPTETLQNEWISTRGKQYQLSSIASQYLAKHIDLVPIKNRALAYFTKVIKEAPENPASLAVDRSVIESLTAWAIHTQRWLTAYALVRSAELSILENKEWEAWQRLLSQALIATEAAQDSLAQAWVWHQLGTLALFREDREQALVDFSKALKLRQVAGAVDAAAITQNNIKLIVGSLESRTVPAAANPGKKLLLWSILGWGVFVILITWFFLYQQSATREPVVVTSPEPPLGGISLVSQPISTATPTATSRSQSMTDSIGMASSTVTSTALPTETITPTPCIGIVPRSWTATEIRRGDTLSGLAVKHQTSVGSIRAANCLVDDKILAGTDLWLPYVPPTETPTPLPPYLVVQGLRQVGQPMARNGAIVVPIALTVENSGGQDGAFSQISFAYSVGSQQVPVTFYPEVAIETVAAGASIPELRGTLTFQPDLFGQNITLWVVANSTQDLPLQLTFPAPVVRIETARSGQSQLWASFYDEASESWYADLNLTGHIDGSGDFDVESWIWSDGSQQIGSGPNLPYRLTSKNPCFTYDIQLAVTVSYFNGRYPRTETARISSNCPSN